MRRMLLLSVVGTLLFCSGGESRGDDFWEDLKVQLRELWPGSKKEAEETTDVLPAEEILDPWAEKENSITITGSEQVFPVPSAEQVLENTVIKAPLPAPEEGIQETGQIYEDSDGRFTLQYDHSEGLVTSELLIWRIETALIELEDPLKLGPFLLEEPIRIVIEAPPEALPESTEESSEENEETDSGVVTSLESSFVTIRMPVGESTIRNLRRELCYARFLADGYSNVPVWLSEGYAQLFEAKCGYNHEMFRWLQYEGVLTSERMNEHLTAPNDILRRRATGWALCFYYHRHNGENWKQVATRSRHVDTEKAWLWVQEYFAFYNVSAQIDMLQKRGQHVPAELRAQRTALQLRLIGQMQIEVRALPSEESR